MDASGTLNTFSRDKDPVEFSAASCNLGLLGVIYSYTLLIEPMFNVVMVSIPLRAFLSGTHLFASTDVVYFHSLLK